METVLVFSTNLLYNIKLCFHLPLLSMRNHLPFFQVVLVVFRHLATSHRKRLAPSGPVIPSLPLQRSAAEEKRQRRLEKNREIAKNCRKRKKEKKEALEEEIKYLSKENARLRIQLQDDTDDESRTAQRIACLRRLKEQYEAHNAVGIAREMHTFVADWVSFGQKRLTMAEFHLDQLKSLILPTQVSGMTD